MDPSDGKSSWKIQSFSSKGLECLSYASCHQIKHRDLEEKTIMKKFHIKKKIVQTIHNRIVYDSQKVKLKAAILECKYTQIEL